MIYLIITTSINHKTGCESYEMRMERYLYSINQSLQNILPYYKVIIVENNGNNQTYLDQFKNNPFHKCDVYYTNNNNLYEKSLHKGVCELMDIKDAIRKYAIKNDDIIIKLTGRYRVLNSTFFDIIRQNYGKYDAFVKFFNVCTGEYMFNDMTMGLFALKAKYFKMFEYKEKNQSPEVELSTFIRCNCHNIYEIKDNESLGLECYFAGSLEKLIV